MTTKRHTPWAELLVAAAWFCAALAAVLLFALSVRGAPAPMPRPAPPLPPLTQAALVGLWDVCWGTSAYVVRFEAGGVYREWYGRAARLGDPPSFVGTWRLDGRVLSVECGFRLVWRLDDDWTGADEAHGSVPVKFIKKRKGE